MIILPDDDGQRLDRFLKNRFPTLTFGQTQKLIRTGQIRINGGRVKGDNRLAEGDELRLPPSLANDTGKRHHNAFSQADRDLIESLILYEDDSLIALNKPAGLAVQGGTKTHKHIDGMLNSYAKKGVKPRLCHRLDRDTSGVLLLGKTAEATRNLTKGFQSHLIEKTYWTLTHGVPELAQGTINANLGKSDHNDKMIHDEDFGKTAITDYEIIDSAGKNIAFVAFYPRTGRTHQIRVHAQIMKTPILFDPRYNDLDQSDFDDMDLYKGLHLHARQIKFSHPETGNDFTIEAPLSQEMSKSWKSFGFNV
jgi:23S rRNA pseudouridine955/2504/2580 synthase